MKKLVVSLIILAGLAFFGFRLFQETWGNSAPESGSGRGSPGGRGFPGGFASRGASVLVETGRLKTHVYRGGREFTGELLPYREVEVIPRVTGYLQMLEVEEADRVHTGDLLAEIDAADVQQQILRQQAALAVAVAGANREQAMLENLRGQVDRNKSLYNKGLVSLQDVEDIDSRLRVAEAQYQLAQSQVDQARASVEELKIQYERTRVYSPMDGVVAERHVDPGALVGQNTPIVKILDLTRLKTIVPVPEGSISGIRSGIEAEVRLDANPGQTYRGRISRIRPIVDAETRSVNVEIEIENPRETLRPGMFARVRFGGGAASEAPSVPRSALLTRGNSQGVYVLGDGNVAVFREIEVGRNEDGWLEILGGLSPGDVFITTGAQNVNEGDTVRLAGGESAPARGEARGEGARGSLSDASATADREHSAP